MRGRLGIGAVMAVALAAGLRAQAPDERAAARQVVAKFQDAIVHARIVLKTRVVVGGREMQSGDDPIDAVATVIDPSGLAVLSLSALNPAAMMNRFMGSATGNAQDRMQLSSEPTDVRMRLSDGREVPASIVLRDEDLDLAFIRPTAKPDKPLPSVDLAADGKPGMLDSIVVLSRLGRVGGWSPAVTMQEVQAIIERPRRLYVIGGAAAGSGSGIGMPAFLLNGKVVGLLVVRSQSAGSGGSGFLGMMGGGTESFGMLPVILPAADVREIASQIK